MNIENTWDNNEAEILLPTPPEEIIKEYQLEKPSDEDIFIHGIYIRGEMNWYDNEAQKKLCSITQSGSIKSASMTEDHPRESQKWQRELNTYTFKTGEDETGFQDVYGSTKNAVTFAFLGEDIKDHTYKAPLSAKPNKNVAALINKFDSEQRPLGCELPLEKAYLVITTNVAYQILPKIKAFADKLPNPNEWLRKHIILQEENGDPKRIKKLIEGIHNKSINAEEITRKEINKTIHIPEEKLERGTRSIELKENKSGEEILVINESTLLRHVQKIIPIAEAYPPIITNTEFHQEIKETLNNLIICKHIREMELTTLQVGNDLYIRDPEGEKLLLIKEISNFKESTVNDKKKWNIQTKTDGEITLHEVDVEEWG